jgi:asparagine synthase (glutamine-hydrolysing)
MCGIAGIYHYSNASPASRTELESLTDVLSHRGPDGSGYYIQGPVGLGHRRLSIIDLAGGSQPIFNEDGSIAVVLNGEIYNYLELRADLERKGHQFATRSDTEVIVHLYEEIGADCFCRLHGMFSIGLWDDRNQRLLLVRDRVGKKPLYYFADGGSLYFASELKSFFKLNGFKPSIDPASLYDYLAYMCVPSPRTIFKNVFKLEPGYYLKVDPAGISQSRYWDLHFAEDSTRDEATIVERLDLLLADAVKARLVSDVPLGAFLSGGVDSSAVVALMVNLSAEPVVAASIGFSDPRFDETLYSRQVADLYRCKHYVRSVDQDDLGLIDQLVWHYDEPFGDPSALPTYQLCAAARQHMKVALSGDGSDELIAGYRRYTVDAMENTLRSLLPAWIRRRVLPSIANLYPSSESLPSFLRAKTALTNLSLSSQEAHFNSIAYFNGGVGVFNRAFLSQINGYNPISVMQKHYDECDSGDALNRILYVDMKTYLAERMLVKMDRASMAHGLEVRNPFLDHRLIEFLATVPSTWKLRNGEKKYILKKAMAKRLPREILRRPKQGFDIPVDHWFRTKLKTSFDALLLDPSTALFDYFDRSFLEQLWREHISGRRNHGNKLWIFYIFERWHRRFIG